MKRINITLFGMPLVGVEALSDASENGKSLKEYAKETVTAAKQTIHTAATNVASATAETAETTGSE